MVCHLRVIIVSLVKTHQFNYQRILSADASMNTSIQEIHEHTASEAYLSCHLLRTLCSDSKNIKLTPIYCQQRQPMLVALV